MTKILDSDFFCLGCPFLNCLLAKIIFFLMQVQREAKMPLCWENRRMGGEKLFLFLAQYFVHLKNFLRVFSFREYSKPKHVSAFAPSRVGSKPQRLVY